MRLRRISSAEIYNMYRLANDGIVAFRDQKLAQAPDAIAKEQGYADFAQMQGVHNRLLLLEQETNGRGRQEKLSALQIMSPDCYARKLSDFRTHDVVLKILFDDAAPKLLQIASNYGPYLYYLKSNRGFDVTGLDIDSCAIKYGQNTLGLNIVNGQAHQMPFADNGFDCVLSRHFLDPAYIMLFCRDYGQYIQEVQHEILRILKPGGFFISFLEGFAHENWRIPTIEYLEEVKLFSPDDLEAFMELEKIAVFQKPEDFITR